MSFRNEPILELRRAPMRESLLEALRGLDARLPLAVPVLVGGERGSASGLDSTDPGAPDRVVARAGSATEADAAASVEAAERGFRDWGARSAAERAKVLRRAAALHLRQEVTGQEGGVRPAVDVVERAGSDELLHRRQLPGEVVGAAGEEPFTL